MTPENTAQLQVELRRDEGISRIVYADTMGIPTTGIGHNLRAKPLPNGYAYPLTDVQIYTILQNDLQDDVIEPLDAHCPWWTNMDDVRQRVIANMCFNMGIQTLLTFHNTLTNMQTGNYDAAANGMNASAWAGEVGERATRLITMMRTGEI